MGHTTITLTGDGVRDAQNWNIQIAVAATVNIDAKMARRRVTAWLGSEVGNMLIGGEPQLVIGRQTVWRVPVQLTSSHSGTVGQVGVVEIDAESGEVLVTDQLREEILANVQHLASPAQISAG